MRYKQIQSKDASNVLVCKQPKKVYLYRVCLSCSQTIRKGYLEVSYIDPGNLWCEFRLIGCLGDLNWKCHLNVMSYD